MAHPRPAAAQQVSDAQVDAAAAVLWDSERFLRRDVDWAGATDDERLPYRHMARKMLVAAAATR